MAAWSWTGGTIVTGEVSLPIAVTNDGGTLSPGGAGIGTTAFVRGTSYTQGAGGKLAIGIDDTGAADLLITSGGLATLGGTIEVSVVNGGPAGGGSWDIVVAQDGGAIAIDSSLSVTLPRPLWSVTSDSTRIAVTLSEPPELLVSGISDGLAVFNNILLSKGDSASTKTLGIANGGDLDLIVTTVTVTGTSFTLIELLIVIAIIAILALIAIPNFLEALTRAKVSRAKSDMRTIATGLEACFADYQVYPAHYKSTAYDQFDGYVRVFRCLSPP